MAEKKFFVDINLQGSALTNAKIGTNTGIGSTEGAFGYDSASHRLQYFNGTATKDVANLSDISAVTGGLIFQGGYDPTTDTPDITDGSALKGFFWAATAAGTFLGESVQVGDSIVAKVDNAGATIADWLILQGNIVIATDSVDGISRLATQAEADAGTEAGAVVITPATLQGKIDAQITPEISSKLPLAGGTMSGTLNMGNNTIDDVNNIRINAAPTDGKDATNKAYVDVAASTAQANAEANASADATAKADAAQAAAEAYADTGLATKLNLAGGTMTGNIDMGNSSINNADQVNAAIIVAGAIDALAGPITVSGRFDYQGYNGITNLGTPTAGGDATNKTYVDGAASTAQTNAEAYADSLAPNYDAAGAAATAESNANAYTDTEIAAQSYYGNIEPSAFELLMDGSYFATITHNLNLTASNGAVVNFYYNSELAEFRYRSNDNNTSYVYSNFLPAETVSVSMIKAQGNI